MVFLVITLLLLELYWGLFGLVVYSRWLICDLDCCFDCCLIDCLFPCCNCACCGLYFVLRLFCLFAFRLIGVYGWVFVFVVCVLVSDALLRTCLSIVIGILVLLLFVFFVLLCICYYFDFNELVGGVVMVSPVGLRLCSLGGVHSVVCLVLRVFLRVCFWFACWFGVCGCERLGLC